MSKNLTKRKDGSYVLKHKTTKAKKGVVKSVVKTQKIVS